MVDTISLAIALAAVAVSIFIYLETRKQRKLTEVMVESLAFLQRRSKPRRAPRALKPTTPEAGSPPHYQTQVVVRAPTQPSVGPSNTSKPPSAAEQARLALAVRREERKRLELQLQQQREQWKRQKDVAKAIGWVLDRIGSDDEADDDYD